ncbi:MAG: class I SAM-dependent methyltransferase [Deltaproteobacteria bacterium]|nr:class I SAM-dependent methyltransferase [Deltaproteobacteria bacterium]
MNLCLVCQRDDWHEKYKIEKWTVLICKHCFFGKIHPFGAVGSREIFYSKEQIEQRNLKQKSRGRKFFAQLKRWSKNLTRRDKNKIFFNRLATQLPKGASILDVGCGAGAFLKHAQPHFQCTGIEISNYLGEQAKTLQDVNILVGDFLREDFKGKTFDGIAMISIIEHFSDPKAALQKCFDLLNPKGILSLKTVNFQCWNRKINRQKWTGFRPPDHLVYFGPQNLARLLRDIGFQKVTTSAFALNDNFYCDAYKGSAR